MSIPQAAPALSRKRRIQAFGTSAFSERLDARNIATLSTTDGVGSRLSLQEVFNRACAEINGRPYAEGEPLNTSDVLEINRDIRSEIYDIKGFNRRNLTFTSLIRNYPVFLNLLRGKIEKKWDILQKCKAQRGVDWAIQRVLQRDRICPPTSKAAARRAGTKKSTVDRQCLQCQSSLKPRGEAWSAVEVHSLPRTLLRELGVLQNPRMAFN